jgi:hypothetical protein
VNAVQISKFTRVTIMVDSAEFSIGYLLFIE